MHLPRSLMDTQLRWFRLPMLLLTLVLAVSSSAPAAELAENQKKQLDTALGMLRQAQATYEMTAGSTGQRSLTGARLKLALVRLESAEASIEQASEVLAGLPADQADVQAATAAKTSLAQAVATLKSALTAAKTPTSPASNDSAPPSDPAAGQQAAAPPAEPLSATQREQLAQVDLILRKADVDLDTLEPLVDQLLQDPATPGSLVQQAGTAIMQTNSKLLEAKAILEQMPLDHPRIAAVATAWNTELARTQAAAQKLLPRWTAVQEAGGKANYPTYDQDIEMLAGLGDVYRDHDLDLQHPEKMAQTLTNDAIAKTALQRLAATYQPMIEQQTAEGQALARQLQRTIGARQTYLNAVIEHQPALIARIEALLKEASSLRVEAVAEQKPLYFTGGIQDTLRRADHWITVLKAYAPDLAAPYAASLSAERTAVNQAQASLHATIIQANPLPTDAYAGADRQQLVDLAIESWKKEQPDATILAVRIPAQAWNRVTRWAGETTGDAKVRGSKIEVAVEMTKYDNSKLQVQLIVADENPELAVIRPVNLWKNHQAGDTITAHNFRALDDELPPQDYLLRAKVP